MPSVPPPTAYPPGTKLTVGSHEVVIEKYISEGGFAHVYSVRVDPPTPGHELECLKRVAVPNKAYLNLLRAEVEAMQRLKGCSNVVQYIDSHAERMRNGNNGYEVFLLMEFCGGGGLIDFMNTRLRDQLREFEVLKIMYDITIGLAQMHYLQPPLIHRDLKIENVLIADDKVTYKLCDFGSASPPLRVPKTPQEYRILEDDIQHHTTLQYRSPEMVDLSRGFPINEKSDIWALGVFLYKLCYYTTPFERPNQTLEQLNATIASGAFTFPSRPNYSERLRNMIRVLLQVNPTMRPNVYQVLEEVSSMRNVDCPLPDIYTPTQLPQTAPLSVPQSMVSPAAQNLGGGLIPIDHVPAPISTKPNTASLNSSLARPLTVADEPVSPMSRTTSPKLDEEDVISRFPSVEELSLTAHQPKQMNYRHSNPPPHQLPAGNPPTGPIATANNAVSSAGASNLSNPNSASLTTQLASPINTAGNNNKHQMPFLPTAPLAIRKATTMDKYPMPKRPHKPVKPLMAQPHRTQTQPAEAEPAVTSRKLSQILTDISERSSTVNFDRQSADLSSVDFLRSLDHDESGKALQRPTSAHGHRKGHVHKPSISSFFGRRISGGYDSAYMGSVGSTPSDDDSSDFVVRDPHPRRAATYSYGEMSRSTSSSDETGVKAKRLEKQSTEFNVGNDDRFINRLDADDEISDLSIDDEEQEEDMQEEAPKVEAVKPTSQAKKLPNAPSKSSAANGFDLGTGDDNDEDDDSSIEFRPSNLIQQRVHAFLNGQVQEQKAMRTARGYGKFVDEQVRSQGAEPSRKSAGTAPDNLAPKPKVQKPDRQAPNSKPGKILSSSTTSRGSHEYHRPHRHDEELLHLGMSKSTPSLVSSSIKGERPKSVIVAKSTPAIPSRASKPTLVRVHSDESLETSLGTTQRKSPPPKPKSPKPKTPSQSPREQLIPQTPKSPALMKPLKPVPAPKAVSKTRD